MDDNVKVEKWTLEDGRRAEKRVTEIKDANGQSEKIIELHVEDERPLRLQQRIVEKSKPIVYERKLETVDIKTGSVIEQKVESIESRVPMQVVEHIGTYAAVSAQGAKDADKPVTRQELIDAIAAAFRMNASAKSEVRMDKVASKVEAPKKVVKSLGLAEEFEKMSVPQKDGMSMMDKILLCVIAAQVVGLGYILFFM
jgi:hypothetical protein